MFMCMVQEQVAMIQYAPPRKFQLVAALRSWIRLIAKLYYDAFVLVLLDCKRFSQARFTQFRVIERFCIECSNKRSDRGPVQ